ncbi:MAG TPA: DNA alkylation repair protein [Burkholderiaceae bacterium]|nr:DNA alkylation repair protein [Burkholderiaceae bacterium]
MAELLKHRFSKTFVGALAAAIARAEPHFDAAGFQRAVLGAGWPRLELKQRMRRISETLHRFLPGDYPRQLAVLCRIAPAFSGLEAMSFPDFVAEYGLDDFARSVAALELFTPYSSSEFAVRPFIVRHGDRMLAEIARWARHPDQHVRRLASEGARPRLPWAMALPRFKEDPRPLLPILEALRSDPSEYVRRSVANNLNDIGKDHPDLLRQIAGRWHGQSRETDRLLQHACRTLLKRGDQRALRLFGHDDAVPVVVGAFKLGAQRIPIGSDLAFAFTVRAARDTKARIEYAIDFVKSDGGTRRKVFQIGVKALTSGTALSIARKHRFRDFTTRKHYPGRHTITIVVNGVARADRAVRLVAG